MPRHPAAASLLGVGDAIGQILPTAVAVAISPFPIIAVVLMLVTPRGRRNGTAFVVGWVMGLAVLGGVVLLAASGADASDDGAPATWVSVLKLLLGLAALAVGVKQLRGRNDGAAEPKWMHALDQFTAIKAAGTGALLAAANPKNLLLVVAAAATIAQTGIDAGEQAIALGVFVLLATTGVGLPVALALIMGERSRVPLVRLKDWLAQNNAVIIAVLLVVIGVKLIGDAITGF